MPHYDYECQKCGHTFEIFQSMAEAPLKICPQCQGEVRRLIGGGTGIIFKVNDSRKGASPKADSGASSTTATSASKGSGASGKSSPESQ